MSVPRRPFGKALSAGLDILEALRSADGTLAFGELGRTVELSPASFTRFLKILLERGYAARDPDGRYRLGSRAAELGLSALEGFPLGIAARPHLEALAAATEESAEAVAFEGDEFVFVSRVESPRSVVLRARAGSRFGVSSGTAIGRVATASCKAAGRGRSFPGIAGVRKTGFAELLQNEGEVHRAASAVFDHNCDCVGCLSIAAPAFRVGRREKARFRRLLLEHSRALSKKLGWPEGSREEGAST